MCATEQASHVSCSLTHLISSTERREAYETRLISKTSSYTTCKQHSSNQDIDA